MDVGKNFVEQALAQSDQELWSFAPQLLTPSTFRGFLECPAFPSQGNLSI